jgi:hypothetical protein
MTKDEALDLALEALENCYAYLHEDEDIPVAITAIKQARSAPVQEPVGQLIVTIHDNVTMFDFDADFDAVENLGAGQHGVYTTPPAAQRTWVGLTDDERDSLIREFNGLPVSFYKAIEAKLKEKNT